MRHRGVEYAVQEDRPERWRWIIYPGVGPAVVGLQNIAHANNLWQPQSKRSTTESSEAGVAKSSERRDLP
jgi:hypothetical protein